MIIHFPVVQDFLRSAIIANEDNVLQPASAVAHLDTHIGQGGIDLMVCWVISIFSFLFKCIFSQCVSLIHFLLTRKT